MDLNRRRLLQSLAGTSLIVVTAGLGGCASRRRVAPERSGSLYPQGLASGDPRPDSVILWTRLAAELIAAGRALVECEVATDPHFRQLVLRETVPVDREDDFTLRIKVQGLDADTSYYYRFIHDGRCADLTGQTRTAPAIDDDQSVAFAVASCQNFEAGYFVAYRHLLDSIDQQQIRFVLHLGDFIYESLHPERAARPFGGPTSEAAQEPFTARTLDDYRGLYRGYLVDPDLRRLRARLPFVCIWDDHEFANDCWQSHSPYSADGQAEPDRKIAANRAWFEYIPCDLSDARLESDRRLSLDFPAAGASNGEAIASLRGYRKLNWGRHVELLLTDTRSYRQAHPVPEAVALEHSVNPRALLPPELVADYDGRREQADTAMLGQAQHDWLLQQLQASVSSWQLLASSVPLTTINIDLDFRSNAIGTPPVVLTTDTWAGFASERAAILQAAANSRANLVALSADHHMHFIAQSELPTRRRWTEIGTAGISSSSLHTIFRQLSGMFKFAQPSAIENFNTSLLQGSRVACDDCAPSRESTSPNPELRYIDSAANGYTLLTVQGPSLQIAQHVFSEQVVTGGGAPTPRYVLRGELEAEAQRLQLRGAGPSPAGSPVRQRP